MTRMLTYKIIRKLVLWVLFFVALTTVLSGCWGKLELEERSFIEVIGVDRGVVEELLVTVVIALPRAHAPEGPGGEGPSSLILSAEGRDFLDALIKLGAFSSRELSGTHTAILILGEFFAKDDVGPIIDAFSRGVHLRPNTLVAICEGTANSFLHRLQSPEEMTATDYLQKIITFGFQSLGLCPMVTVHDFSVRYQSIGESPWAPYIGLAATESRSTEKGASDPSPWGTSQESSEPSPGVVLGTAVFTLEEGLYKMAGHLDPEESKIALLMAGFNHNWFFTLAYPGDLQTATVSVQHSSVRLTTEKTGDVVQVHFRIRLACSLDEYVVNPDAPLTTQEMRTAAAKTTQEQLEILASRTINRLKGLKSDPVSIGKSAAGLFLTYPQWEAFDWPSKFQDIRPTFDIGVQVFSTGFTFQRAFPH